MTRKKNQTETDPAVYRLLKDEIMRNNDCVECTFGESEVQFGKLRYWVEYELRTESIQTHMETYMNPAEYDDLILVHVTGLDITDHEGFKVTTMTFDPEILENMFDHTNYSDED